MHFIINTYIYYTFVGHQYYNYHVNGYLGDCNTNVIQIYKLEISLTKLMIKQTIRYCIINNPIKFKHLF